MSNLCSQAPLSTTPIKKKFQVKYDINYVSKKAENVWEDIWDSLGIPCSCLSGKCPQCKQLHTFQLLDASRGIFYCSHCKIRGNGFALLQYFNQWDQDEVLERVGRCLRLRDKEFIYG